MNLCDRYFKLSAYVLVLIGVKLLMVLNILQSKDNRLVSNILIKLHFLNEFHLGNLQKS